MAVSKRLRFEILRRDNHTCRYCGRSAPEVELHVDHVVPTSLGGSDDPSNLVAACADCNSGKSSATADSSLVADVASDALRWAAAMRTAAETAQEQREAQQAVHEAFAARWDSVTFTGMGYIADIPDDWQNSVDRFLAAGLTLDDLLDFAYQALTKFGVDRKARWRYFCGICHRIIRERQETARAIVAEAAEPTRDLHCQEGECRHHEQDGAECIVCSRDDCAWMCGYDYGIRWMSGRIGPTSRLAMLNNGHLSNLIDGRMLAEMGVG